MSIHPIPYACEDCGYTALRPERHDCNYYLGGSVTTEVDPRDIADAIAIKTLQKKLDREKKLLDDAQKEYDWGMEVLTRAKERADNTIPNLERALRAIEEDTS